MIRLHKLLLLLIGLSLHCTYSHAQSNEPIPIRGEVVSLLEGQSLAGVNVVIKGSQRGVITDAEGRYALSAEADATLIFSFVGYESLEVPINGRSLIDIALAEDISLLSAVEIYSTGYEEVSPERTTGSFVHIDEALLNRSVSTDILSRLKGVTNALAFDERVAGSPKINIRGVSTLYANQQPLIVLNNFPYEGDISNINPNDIESITILKDAAAASIWGVRAGNGVIVITTKKGKQQQAPKLSFTSNVTVRSKPDFSALPLISSSDFIDMEQFLFEKGFYNNQENSLARPALSPVVERLIQQRDGLISAEEAEAQINAFRAQDVTSDYDRYLYEPAVAQQYAMNVRGGGERMDYYLSGGYDRNLSNLGQQYNRLSLRSDNNFSPFESLKLHAGIAWSRQETNSGRPAYQDIRPSSEKELYPYARLVDAAGNPQPVERNYRRSYIEGTEELGLLNWDYIPLEDYQHVQTTNQVQELLLNTGLDWKLFGGLTAGLKYQYSRQESRFRSLQGEEAFGTRDYINRFTQIDPVTGNLTRPVPLGAIMDMSNSILENHAYRAQLDYKHSWNKSQLTALAGAEARELVQSGHSHRVYGYDDLVLTSVPVDMLSNFSQNPNGLARIASGIGFSGTTNRFSSYFANAAYTYDRRYTVSGSLRKDASNLFGVNSNQRSIPLWSAGLNWSLHNEAFFTSQAFEHLALRMTYGYNGNLDNTMTALATIRLLDNNLNGAPYANISTYPNPALRWETVGMFNMGLDFRLKNSRIQGSLEGYLKRGDDLIGDSPIDPTAGLPVGSIRRNVAAMQGSGIDLELNSLIIDRDFQWHNTWLFNYAAGKVTRYDSTTTSGNVYVSGGIAPLQGRPVFSVFSYPWAGLDPQTGDPQGIIDGEPSKDYAAIRNGHIRDLVYHGPRLAPVFGAFRNTFSYKGISLSVNITYRLGYYFRRSSTNYALLFNNWIGHEDFAERWQEPGDEAQTHVPSMTYPINNNREFIYSYSEVLVERGDHIRLKDINLSYDFNPAGKKLPFSSLRCFLIADNLGFLWRANKHGLDPDYPVRDFPLQPSLSLGLQATL